MSDSVFRPKVVNLYLKDSFKMISSPLRDFAKMFKLENVQKEVMPYDLYTREFVYGEMEGICDWDYILQNSGIHFTDYDDLKANLHKWSEDCVIISEDDYKVYYNMLNYSRRYCEMDVQVLKKGWNVFRKLTQKALQMDVNAYVTISSLGDAYLCEQGCYEGVFELSGVVQRFCAEATVGGRVMCGHNTRHHHTSDQPALADYDANSLYPSAMIRLPRGLPVGAPKIWEKGVDLSK
eukprot:2119820-Pleurochrysis_carterae.AAC.1